MDKEKVREALKGKKIPMLTLDNKWHQLFTQTGSTSEMAYLMNEINQLLTAQSRYNEEIKGLKKVKKRLMEEIVSSMDENQSDKAAQKKRLTNKQMINECNEKMDEIQDKILDLPRDMDETNIKLMIATMELCQERINDNRKTIEDIRVWVDATRIELKKRLLKKQEAELMNKKMYSYMHDIFGSEIIEILDLHIEEDLEENK